MSGRVEFDAGARRRLREGWRADAGGVLVAQGDAQCAPRSSATLDARPRAATAVASLAFFVAIGLFAAILHGARDRGSFPHAPDRGAVARGASAVGRASRGSEVDVRDSVIFAAGTVGALAMSLGAAAAELQVPSKQYPTIQSAIDAAADGDVVVIAAGQWNERLSIQQKSVSLVGAGAGLTVIDGEDQAGDIPVLNYRNTATTTQSTISDITIQNGGSNGVLLYRIQNLTMRDCEIRWCSATYGAAVVPDGGNTVFERVVFRENTAANGGAVNTAGGFSGVFRDCEFLENTATNAGGAVIDYFSTTTIVGCTFRGNTSSPNYPWVVYSFQGARTTLQDNEFCGNSVASFGACCGGTIVDSGGNVTTPPPCTPPCPADFVDDGTVNAADLGILLNFWGTDGSQFPGVDLNGDGIVGAADLSALLSSWGPCRE